MNPLSIVTSAPNFPKFRHSFMILFWIFVATKCSWQILSNSFSIIFLSAVIGNETLVTVRIAYAEFILSFIWVVLPFRSRSSRPLHWSPWSIFMVTQMRIKLCPRMWVSLWSFTTFFCCQKLLIKLYGKFAESVLCRAPTSSCSFTLRWLNRIKSKIPVLTSQRQCFYDAPKIVEKLILCK